MDELIAFVKARLDEDEAEAREVHMPRTCGSIDRDASFDPDPIWCSCDYPARVLREVAAKRAILSAYERAPDWPGGEDVRYLAPVWSDHPDYRQEWAPEPVR